MNEEKKLNDEAVENVSGGTEDFYGFSRIFRHNNCEKCAKSRKDCPFHDDMAEAYEALDGNSWSSCPYLSRRNIP